MTVDELPLLPSGKPDYQAVRALARDADQPESDATTCARLFADVLQIDPADHRSRCELRRPRRQLAVLRDDVGAARTHTRQAARRTGSGCPCANSKRSLRPRAATVVGATLETSVALRAAAIVLIVGSHAELFELWGGAHILLGVAGYNFGRFCLTPVPRRRPGAAPAQHHRVDRGAIGDLGRHRARDHRRLPRRQICCWPTSSSARTTA